MSVPVLPHRRDLRQGDLVFPEEIHRLLTEWYKNRELFLILFILAGVCYDKDKYK